jgi:hypothetical protein
MECKFLSKKGKCKYLKKKLLPYCKLKSLLSRNGQADKKELQVTFLECYLRNLKVNEEIGKKFFKENLDQILGRHITPLSEHDAYILLNVLNGKAVSGFRVPLGLERFTRLFNK